MKIKPLPTQARLREVLAYSPESGVFIWLPRTEKAWKHSLDWSVAGTRNPKGISIFVDGVAYYAHRLAWVYVHGDVLDTETQVDHENCDCYDNRLKNLRPATHGQNGSNSRGWRVRKHDLPKGVYKPNRGGYAARIGVNGEVIHIGTFDTPEEAHAAYVAAARRAKGEFARAE